ncbi:MAG: A/G-specific adenine glycosylase [Selenomonadaceae bacterium]|nr:A/G-specific adenine glycosylase [Selenomonadaceae bacterium]
MEQQAMAHEEILEQITVPLMKWYHAHARVLPWREQPTPYRVWLSEIMLQQTRVAAVMPYFERFLETLPSISALADADEETLLKLWQGLGYYNRARNLQKTARIVMEKYNGMLPEDFDALLSLPGIGRYTAAAISSIAYGHCHPAVDGNVLRVTARLLCYGEDILKDRTKRTVEDALRRIYPRDGAGTMNQSLMELGATVCLPHGAPLCGECPLQSLCLAKKEHRIGDYPQKAKAKQRRIEYLTVLCLEQNGCFAIHKRPAKGLLAGLWELPHLEGWPEKQELRHTLQQLGLAPLAMKALPDAVHIFSHVEWHMRGWHVRLADASHVAEPSAALSPLLRELVWETSSGLAQNYSIPAAFQYFLP